MCLCPYRKSAERARNNFGNKLLQLCRNNNLYICNGRINADTSYALICIKGSVIDYLIANINGLLKINNFIVHEYSPFLSDVHCAISFSLSIKILRKQAAKTFQVKHKKWETSKRSEFLNNFDRSLVESILSRLQSSFFNNSINKDKINSIVSQILIH